MSSEDSLTLAFRELEREESAEALAELEAEIRRLHERAWELAVRPAPGVTVWCAV